MGFSVTAAHAILLVGLLGASSALGAALVRAHDQAADARRVDADLRDARVHTAVAVLSQAWDAGAERITFTLENEGTTTLDVRRLDFVVDGRWMTDKVEPGWTVDGEAGNWWPPQTDLQVSLAGVGATEPADVVITTEYGTQIVWRG